MLSLSNIDNNTVIDLTKDSPIIQTGGIHKRRKKKRGNIRVTGQQINDVGH